MADFDWGSAIGGLGNLWGQYQGQRTAAGVNGQVQGILGNQQQLAQQQGANLQQQVADGQRLAMEAYQRSLGNVQSQNAGLEGNIGTMTASLNALSDPNSPYMQMARQGIERKDAAAGRRSQWGEREVQLAGTLADYVGKYAPSINNSISSARNQISQNDQGLANLYSQMMTSPDRNNMSLSQLISGLSGVANAANTTGRGAANAQTNSMTSLLGGAGGQLSRLLGNMGGANILGNMFGLNDASSQSLWGGLTGSNNVGGVTDMNGGVSINDAYGPNSGWGQNVDYGGYSPQLDFNDPTSGMWD